MAAAVVAAQASPQGLPVQVASAGLMRGGTPTDPHVVSVMGEWGVDMSQKLSRQISMSMLRASDLIIPMTSRHARRVIGEEPKQRHKVFLFREIPLIARHIGGRTAAESPQGWVSRANEVRGLDYVSDVDEFNVPDPVTKPRPVFVKLRDEFQQYSAELLAALFPG